MVRDLITEKDILDYLMTSDFNEGLTNDEAKFLLLKYRNFYRSTFAKNEQLTFLVDELKTSNGELRKELNRINLDNSNLKIELETEKNRDLSWKERFFGKKIKK